MWGNTGEALTMLRGEARVKSGQLKGGVLISLTDKGKVLEWQLNIDMSLISDSWPRCPKGGATTGRVRLLRGQRLGERLHHVPQRRAR